MAYTVSKDFEIEKIAVEGPVELLEAFQKKVLRDTEFVYAAWFDVNPPPKTLYFYACGQVIRRSRLSARDMRAKDARYIKVPSYSLPTEWDRAFQAIEDMLNPPMPKFEDLEVGTVFEVEGGYVLMKTTPTYWSEGKKFEAVCLRGRSTWYGPGSMSLLFYTRPIVRVLGKLDPTKIELAVTK